MTKLAQTISDHEADNEHHKAVLAMATALNDVQAAEALTDINVRHILVGHIEDDQYSLRNVIRKGLKARCEIAGLL